MIQSLRENIAQKNKRETELNGIIGSIKHSLVREREARDLDKKNIGRILEEYNAQIDLVIQQNKAQDVALDSVRERIQREEEQISQLRLENQTISTAKKGADVKISQLLNEKESLFEKHRLLKSELQTSSQKLSQFIAKYRLLSEQFKTTRGVEAVLRKTTQEAPLGFPTLLDAIKLYDEKRDQQTSSWLASKQRPALKASIVVQEETQKRRQAEYECRQAKCLLDYYRNIFPSIEDDREQGEEDLDPVEAVPTDEHEDIVRRYLSKEEYQQLSVSERNQQALDRFWARNKSKQLIGKLYEQYIGYLHEQQGYKVDYFGISEGLSDLGRDLICHKDEEILLVQCKNWSRSKTIYEKHIFQFFGTLYQFAKGHPQKRVRGAFYTATSLSEMARSFAEEFNIRLHENFPLEQYPIIKCKANRNGERIYHLPFDLQYDITKINPKDGDRYCTNVAEAEAAGFRRAYRWHGTK